MHKKYNASVEINKITENAIILRVFPDFPIRKFLPGQYGSLGLASNLQKDKLIKRAYSIGSSILNDSNDSLVDQKKIKYLEFYINKVDKINKEREQITPKLFSLKDGDRIFCGEKIVGHYILKDIDRYDNILLISTHTGESPNNTILNHVLKNYKTIKICNLNCSPSHNWPSLYTDKHNILMEKNSNYNFIQKYDNNSYEKLTKFFDDYLINKNETASQIGFKFNKENILIMLCGDPKMIGAPIKKGGWEYEYPDSGLIKSFEKFGLELSTRFKKGNIVYESYW